MGSYYVSQFAPSTLHGFQDMVLQRRWPIGVTLRHWTHDHRTLNTRVRIDSEFEPNIYLPCFWDIKLQRYQVTTRPWTFVVTWRYRPQDHWTHNIRFSIGGQFEPTICLAWLLTYWASKTLGHDLDLLVSRDVIGRKPLDSQYAGSCKWSFATITLYCMVAGILCQTLYQAYPY